MSHRAPRIHRQRGLTLIELMVAMVLGLLVLAGVITVFMSISASNKAQTQMAMLQESGRFAIYQLSEDIGMANALYCSSSGGSPKSTGAGNPKLDELRAPTVFARGSALQAALSDVTTAWGAGAYPAEPTQTYALPEFFFMRGYDCGSTACEPVDPTSSVPAIPAQGKNVGDRVVGSSILTLRYVDPSNSWSIGEGGSSLTASASNPTALGTINLSPKSGEPPVSDFGAGHLAMLADCSAAQVFSVAGQGSPTLTPLPAGSGNFDTPGVWTGLAGVRLFDFDRSFQTVTYFLQVVDIGDGRKTGALFRRVNGGDKQELVRGIERLGFRYGVMNSSGNTRFMTAKEVDEASTTECPAAAPAPEGGAASANRRGCLWRAVRSIEVALVASGMRPLASLSDSEMAYTFTLDGITTPKPPADHPIEPDTDQGFEKKLLRREFTALLAIRNFNP